MTAPAATAPNALAGDLRALDTLRYRAKGDPQAVVREAARQFEALFMNELVKSMRSTTMDSGLMDGGSGGEMAKGMLDQQFATQLTGMRGGLSEAIANQLQRQMGLSPGPIPATTGANPVPAPLGTPENTPARIPERGAAGFVDQHSRAAQAAEAATGIPAAFMVAQAAHESGWGRREIRHADGAPSHNLFGIKAGAGWNGPVAEITTTEYVDGQARKVTARFRAYASYAESFADYARLMKNNPRYQAVVEAETPQAFAQGLQRAGYATDPAYADKLTRVINTTLRLQRTQG
ncbi:MAG: flagellar assembly peptidoglycan hydrolase FlgJ [Rubrivivax sp.]|nr:flagellar assembly peptidoglycan hydrolase FlgJ [Rubrivivax sp.]